MLKVTYNTWKTNSIWFPGTEIFFAVLQEIFYLIPSSTWMNSKNKWQFN